jgi:endonuclease YncB( thermonuclease family)
MAFDSSNNGQTPRRSSHISLPEAPRPSAGVWDSFRDDGIQWEGQVLIVGSGVDIPALLVLTGSRLALLSGDTIALDVPRTWLRPEPKLLAENGVRFSMTPQGASQKIEETDRLTVRVREGRGAAAKLVSTISGRLVSPRHERGVRHSESGAGWGTTVGAAAPMALPPLPDFGDDLGSTRPKRAWPPVEHNAVPEAAPTARQGVSHKGTPKASIAAWAAENLDEPTDSASADASRRPSRSDRTITWGAPPAEAVVPAADEEHQFNRGLVWGLRSLILAVLVGTGVYFGRDSLPANLDLALPANLEQRLGINNGEEAPTDVSLVPSDNQQAGNGGGDVTPEATKADSDGTNGAPNSDLIGTSDSEDDGLGGTNGEITPVNPGIGEYAEPTEAPQVNEPVTEDPETDGGEALETETVVEPTSVPVTEAPVTEVPATEAPPTEAPATEVPATEPPVTEVPVTEEPATETPVTEVPVTEEPVTEVPATEGPTEVPGRQDPTETPVSQEPTEAPATEEPEATLESQPPSVDDGSTPEQALASGAFRYTITGASRGETVAELPEINDVGAYGEWVVLSMHGENWSDTEQVFDMSQFRLYADGEEVLVDVGNGWVSGLLGHTPAYGNTESILWAGEESHEFALTFLIPPGAQELSLVAGDQTIDLGAALANPEPLAQDAPAANPEYIEAEVVEVINAESIVIEVDGIQQTVRYLGLDVPADDDCFAAEAAEANRALVEGKTVRLERQATDVDARGNWVRDVWAPADDGRYFLVSEALVAEGAATVGISDPNTRYEGWLLGSQSAAKAEGRGLWGACGDDSAAGLPTQPEAIAPAAARATYRRTRR